MDAALFFSVAWAKKITLVKRLCLGQLFVEICSMFV